MNSNQTSRNRDWFTILALGYLLLPSLLFLLTWVRAEIGIPVTLIVVVGFILFIRKDGRGERRPELSAGSWIYVLGLALIWTWLAGAGGFVPQAGDYQKHNLLFHDLLQRTWPVKYANDSAGGANYICYGLGFYLVPVFIARLTGGVGLPELNFLWMLAGTVLFFYWVATFSRAPRRTLAIILIFAMTETLWHLFYHILQQPAWAKWGLHIEDSFYHLGIAPDYSDAFVAIQNRPQHVLAAWLGAALFYESFWARRNPRGTGLVWAACVFWSPMTSLGLLLVPLVGFHRWRWREAIEPVNFTGALLFGVLAVYFQGHMSLDENGPIWKFSKGHEWLVLYPVFLIFQLAPVFLLYLADRKYNLLGELRPLFLGSFTLLVLLPLYKIGQAGDLRLQASTPALLFIALAAGRSVLNSVFSLKRPLFALLLATQLVGATYPFLKWWSQNLSGGAIDYSYAASKARYGWDNLSEFNDGYYNYAPQYLGRPDSVAARRLLR